jgi:hypothetical protein
MIVIGVALSLFASLAVVQTRGLSVAPASVGVESREPKVGQLTFYAPPYCNANPFCAGLSVAIHRLNLQINFLLRLAIRFPILAPVMSLVILILRVVQSRLIRIQNWRFGT